MRQEHTSTYLLLGLIMGTMFLVALSQTLLGTALPHIAGKLNDIGLYSWVFTIYMLTSCVSTILVGSLSDQYGRRVLILIGLAIFILGTLLAGFSGSMLQLIIYRGIQGIGAGAIIALSFISVGQMFEGEKRSWWQGWMTSVYGVASVIGPIIGGFVVQTFHWSWVFWFYLPFLIISGLFLYRYLPVERGKPANMDYTGSALLIGSSLALLLLLGWAGRSQGWYSWEAITLFLAAVFQIFLFIKVEGKAKNPALPLVFFRNVNFTVSNLITFLKAASLYAALVYLPFYIQGIRKVSPFVSGLWLVPLTLSIVIASVWAGQRMAQTSKYKKMVFWSLVIGTVCLFAASRMGADTSWLMMSIVMIGIGVGLGVSNPIFTLIVQNTAAQEQMGTATASTQLSRQLGGALGVGLMGSILQHKMDKGTQHLKINVSDQVKIEALQKTETLINQDQVQSILQSIVPQQKEAAQDLVVDMIGFLGEALSTIFLTGSFIMLGCIILSLFLSELPSLLKK